MAITSEEQGLTPGEAKSFADGFAKAHDALEGGDTPPLVKSIDEINLEAVIKERDELQAANDELTKATETQAATIAQQQQVIGQLQQALGETTGHVLTAVKAMGKVMPP